ncbi:MAG: PAS domain S-box protein [Acidobacteria bacterium]|nr:PAS domain S-box protein [Acidobacteriota bacterium]
MSDSPNPSEAQRPSSSDSSNPGKKKKKRGSTPPVATAAAPPMKEAAWKQVLDLSPCISVIVGADSAVLYFSRFAEQVTGYSAEEVLGKGYLEVFLPDEETRRAAAEQLKDIFGGCLPATLVEGFEQPLWVKEGSPHWIFWHWQLLRNFANRPALLIVGCDITERKRAEEELRESRGFFKTVLDAAPCMTIILRQDHTLAYFSPYAEQATGYRAQEVLEKNYFEIFIPDPAIREGVYEDIQKLAQGVPSRGYENPVWCKDGSKRWFAWNSEVLSDYEGEVGFLGIGLDITAYRQAEEALRQERNYTSAILNTIGALVVVLDTKGRIVSFNRACERTTGYSEEEVKGKALWEFFLLPEEMESVKAVFQQLSTLGLPSEHENYWVTKRGERRWISWSNTILYGSDGSVSHVIGTGIDITERKRAEEAIRSSEARTRALLATIPDWMFRFRRDGTFLDFHVQNPEELVMPTEAIIGGNLYRSPLPGPVVEQIMAAARQALRSGQLQTVEYSLPRKEGTRHYEARISPSGSDEVVAIVRDITRRKQIRDELRRMSKVFLDSADPIVIVDLEGKITDLNEEAVRVYGWKREELLGQSLKILVPPERHPNVAQRLKRCREEGTLRNFEGFRQNKAGKWMPMLMTYSLLTDESGTPVGIATIAKDTSDLKQTQEQLRELSGRLITSQEEASRQIARELHDVFSQRLAVLGMEVSALEKQATPGSPASERLRWLGEEVTNLAKEVHQLSRQFHPAILHDLGLEVALRVECESFSRQHEIPVEFDRENPPEKLPEEVALCLYRVAQESLRNAALHSQTKRVRVTLAGEGGQVRLTVEDFGEGFDPEAIKGKGGLGLISMEERVRLVNGSFSIRSQPEQGTQVEARIPWRRA